MSGTNLTIGHFFDGYDRHRTRQNRFFVRTRGARTFGEIGHGLTPGRGFTLIVNKFSTLAQEFVDMTTTNVSIEDEPGAIEDVFDDIVIWTWGRIVRRPQHGDE